MKTKHRHLYYSGYPRALLLPWVFCVLGVNLHGQGTVVFSNLALGVAPITNSLTGQPAEPGTTFSVALYFAPDGATDESTFTQLGASVNIGVYGGIPHLQLAGYFIGGIRTAPIIPPGGFGMFQVRAWETVFGTTYEEAVANTTALNGRLALAGQSGIMRVNTGDPTMAEPGLPTQLVAGQPDVVAVVGSPLSDGFLLTVVPEPASILLLLFGLPPIVLLSFLRLKRCRSRPPRMTSGYSR